MVDELDEDLEILLTSKLEEGKNLLEKLRANFPSLDGCAKLERKIRAELNFLLKLKGNLNQERKQHILSTNLSSLSSILQLLEKSKNPIAVFKPFRVDNGGVSRIEVDVVSDGGAVWQKAVARKPEALDDISRGQGLFGQKSVIDHARIYLECAKLHPHLFIPPKVVFFFTQGVTTLLAKRLSKLGILVEGERIKREKVSYDSEESNSDSDEESIVLSSDVAPLSINQPSSNDKLFLDITCMVAYVSSMTNGGANFMFPRPIYNQQAEWERTRPAKPKLDALFERCELVTCSVALQDFKGLVDKMGGPGEKERTEKFLNRLQVVADEPSERVANMHNTASVKDRSKVIFGTADRLGIVIVTANTGFIRSAFIQGVEIAHHEHEPRVLTEQQEIFANRLEL